jgi:hypothetical protein
MLYQRYIHWNRGAAISGEPAIELLRVRRLRAHICAPLTLHLNKRKACALGDEHNGCCPGTCKRSAQLTLNY